MRRASPRARSLAWHWLGLPAHSARSHPAGSLHFAAGIAGASRKAPPGASPEVSRASGPRSRAWGPPFAGGLGGAAIAAARGPRLDVLAQTPHSAAAAVAVSSCAAAATSAGDQGSSKYSGRGGSVWCPSSVPVGPTVPACTPTGFLNPSCRARERGGSEQAGPDNVQSHAGAAWRLGAADSRTAALPFMAVKDPFVTSVHAHKALETPVPLPSLSLVSGLVPVPSPFPSLANQTLDVRVCTSPRVPHLAWRPPSRCSLSRCSRNRPGPDCGSRGHFLESSAQPGPRALGAARGEPGHSPDPDKCAAGQNAPLPGARQSQEPYQRMAPGMGPLGPVPGVGSLLLKRIQLALTTVPSPSSCLFTLGLLAAASGPMAACAVWANAFSLAHAAVDPLVLAKAVFIPCLAEELLWRASLIPHRALETASQDEVLFWGIFSTLIYVVAHPVLAYTTRPAALALFGHPGFLTCCAILGGICAMAYRQSGSVWTAVFLHWAVVAVWLSLGGRQRAPFF